MSYRSLKRVLGETNLEKKCRFLFGLFLVVVLVLAFLTVYWRTQQLVYNTTQRKGRDLADMALLSRHFLHWETDMGRKELVKEMIQGLETETYEFRRLDFSGNADFAPRDEWEAQQLEELYTEVQQRSREEAAQEQQAAEGPVVPAEINPDDFRTADSASPLFRQRILNDQYHYYQPVVWKVGCRRCHDLLDLPPGTGPVAENAGDADRELPFRVITVAFPVGETEAAMRWLQAALVFSGILTFFLAMLAMYAVVQYVVVRPLTHLRDVSEEVSRGKTEMRAELHTGDEFEDLGDAFNRMLRHLTDTQTELQDLNVDLDAKVDQLAQLNMQLYEMNKLKGEFLANMSHELRTPLNSIIGFSEVLQGASSLNDKQKRYAQNIQKSGRLLLEMINDILDFAKLEAGKMEIRAAEFQMEQVVASQCDLVRSLTDEKNIDLEVQVEPGAPPMFQDQGKLQQILTNLLSNAIKFTPEGGRIVVRCRRDEEGRLELTVEDTGVGIASEDREIIFEKFRQAPSVVGNDRLTREYSGTGLGLSIVKESCKLLGGEVSFESELGKGSTFKVVLPWTIANEPRRDSEIASRLDEITRLRRGELSPAAEAVQ
ncbi:MAG: ATP-binding protein [Pirellulaceae bacterium]